MHATPLPAPPPRPEQLGCEYGTPMSDRDARSIPFPNSLVMYHESPRSREMNSERPPRRSVRGLCGEMMTGESQLNWIVAPAIGLMMFARLGAGPAPSPPSPPAAAAPPRPPP